MTDIVKSNTDIQITVADELAKNDLDIKVGDNVISSDGDVYEISKIEMVKDFKWEDDEKGKSKKVKFERVEITFGYYRQGKWCHYGANNIENRFRLSSIK